jgi:hypothetical protein
MPLTSFHPEYLQHQDDWRTLRDAMGGSTAVRLQGTRYVPRPGGMSAAQYTAYLARAEWYNATARTVRGLAGEVFRKPMTLEGLDSDLLTAWQQDVTGQGLPLLGFAATLLHEVLLMGHYGVLLDVRLDPVSGRPVPVWAGYPVEQIRNWTFTRTAAGLQLTRLVLGETDWRPQAGDPDEREALQRYRVLTLEEGVYRVQCYEPLAGGELVLVESAPPPLRRGGPLPFLPFVLFGPSGLAWCLHDSLLLPLVQMNLRHWRHSCDYEHGLHLTALPTLVISGHNTAHDVPEDGRAAPRIVLGSQGGIVLPEPEAKAYLLEYQGQGLQALETALASDKADMAVMGARLLEERPQVEEREVAVRHRRAADTSTLRQVAEAVSLGLTRLGQWSAWWAGEVDTPDGTDVRLTLNRDYQTARLAPQDLQALMQATQQGLISRETWFYNLTQGEITEPGVSYEAEEARIAAQPPVTLPLGA